MPSHATRHAAVNTEREEVRCRIVNGGQKVLFWRKAISYYSTVLTAQEKCLFSTLGF